MKLSRSLCLIAVLLVAFLALTGCADVAQTARATAQTDDIGRLLDFVTALGALVPVIVVAAPLISTIIDAAKKIGMASKYAPALSAALNALVFTTRYFAGPEHSAQFNSAINALYALAPYVIALVIALLATVGFHNKLTKAGLGYSKTPKKA